MNLLLLTYDKYPHGSAGAVRHHVLAKLLSVAGHKVFVVGMSEGVDFKKRNFNGISYTSFRNPGKGFVSKINNYFGFQFRTASLLNKSHPKFDAILLPEVPLSTIIFLKRYARRRKIMLLHDSVEWYSPDYLKFGKFSRHYLSKDLLNRVLVDKQFKIIAVSKYLQRHFTEKKCQTIRIPVIMDVKGMTFKKRLDPKKIIMVYAGVSAKRDGLAYMLEALLMLSNAEIARVQLRVIGLTENKLVKERVISRASIKKLGNSLILSDFTSRKTVFRSLEEADFTVLLRPKTARFAVAGFSSKVVEGFATATATMCNLTCDLGDFVKDGKNGIVVDDCSSTSFLKAIRSALKLTMRQRKMLSKSARITAERYFEYRLYADKINVFLKSNIK